ncbi:MAG: efflux RND transporter permease subunit, partial [Candidatus Eremiobacteraeota bacterium]|nr:efflux RND transporter permease subunit [Candidatus Eremiobacteraeota bacterium]
KNAILVIEFTKQLREEGADARDALLRAGPIRLRPILMTTLATIGGMLPLALGIEAGSSTQAPLATVVIGGLIASTVLSLLVVPTVYLWTSRRFGAHFRSRRRPPTIPSDTATLPEASPPPLIG